MKFKETKFDKENVSIAINGFVRRQHAKSKFAHFDGSFEQVIDIARENLNEAKIVQGDIDDPKVLVVIVPGEGFYTSTTIVTPNTILEASFESRREEEASAISVVALNGNKEKATNVELILYSHENLAKNKENDTTNDFELISINANLDEETPMHPLTMARNFLEEEGGTKAEYTSEEFAKAIWYWKDKVSLKGE